MNNDFEISIRRVGLEEAKTLTDFSRRTFYDTFASQNDPENMKLYLDSVFTLEKQQAEILDPSREIYLAWKGSVPVGYIHFLEGSVDEGVSADRPIEILRFYVDRPWQGTGVAHSLMEFALRLSHAKQYRTLWLGVWEKNFKAQAFYKKWQFRTVGSHIFQLGKDPQVDLIMQRTLV